MSTELLTSSISLQVVSQVNSADFSLPVTPGDKLGSAYFVWSRLVAYNPFTNRSLQWHEILKNTVFWLDEMISFMVVDQYY